MFILLLTIKIRYGKFGARVYGNYLTFEDTNKLSFITLSKIHIVLTIEFSIMPLGAFS